MDRTMLEELADLHARAIQRIHDLELGTPAAEKAPLGGFVIAALSGALVMLLLLWAYKAI